MIWINTLTPGYRQITNLSAYWIISSNARCVTSSIMLIMMGLGLLNITQLFRSHNFISYIDGVKYLEKWAFMLGKPWRESNDIYSHCELTCNVCHVIIPVTYFFVFNNNITNMFWWVYQDRASYYFCSCS